MNEHVHPLFASILQGVTDQPALLKRAAEKAQPRRFAEQPEPPSAFGALSDGPDEYDELQADQLRDHLWRCG